MKQNIFQTCILLILSGCAGQRMPEGGPKDTTPPEIISAYPAPNTINFSDNKVVFEFSKYVDRRSLEEAVFISPSIEEKEFEWSGTEVEIIFNKELRKNTTYVITVGTDVKDVLEGNLMAKAFSLSFSTGNKIDNGAISGSVYDEKPGGIMIFSYRLNDIKADTLNPTHSKPDYLTQTGKDGSFSLTNVAAGRYRLFAIRDEYRNLLYDPETDDAGTTDDITLTEKDTLVQGLKFIVAREDTTPPRLVSATATDKYHVTARFSEPLDSSTVSSPRFSIVDTLQLTPLKVLDVFPNEMWSSITLITDSQQFDATYKLSVDSVKDKTGHIINPTVREIQFKSSSVKDTLPPELVYANVKDSTTKILSDQPLIFSFSDAPLVAAPDSLAVIRTGRENVAIPYAFSRRSSASFTLQPLKSFTIGATYSVVMRWKGMKDYAGNVYKDTTSIFKFSVLDPDDFGSIEGSFKGFALDSETVITAKNMTSKNQHEAVVKAGKDGKFLFTMLPEGNYVLKAFGDRNKNFIHDAGRVFPYAPSEKFSFYKDTIRVRARWPVDGVQFIGKQ